jgi:hypothetical protein
MGGAEGEGWFAGWTEVGFESGFDGGVGLGEVVLQDACLETELATKVLRWCKKMSLPVLS